MAATQNRDMGSGSIPKLLAQLALPAVVAQVVNLLYNIVDRIYIGHMPEVGASALTGVGLFTPILMLITAFAMLCGSGGAPRAAIAMGRGDDDAAEKIMGNCFTLLLILAAVLTVVFYFAAPSLLVLFGASEKTLPYALDYARIYIIGTIFVLIVMGMNPFVTTQGFATFSMMTTVIGAVCNIILDPILIFALNMGVRGAATATVISQAVGAVWVLRFLTGSRTRLRLSVKNMPLVGKVIGPCLGLGVSTFVMIATESILSISFNSSLARYGGDIAVGAMTIITSATQLLSMPVQGLCQGAQPIISYNYGARSADRVKKAFGLLLRSSLVYSTLLWLALLLFPGMFASIFTSDASLIAFATPAIRVYFAVLVLFGAQIACQMTFTALDRAKESILVAVTRKFIILLPLIYLMPHLFSANPTMAVYMAEPFADAIAVTFTVLLFARQFKKALQKI